MRLVSTWAVPSTLSPCLQIARRSRCAALPAVRPNLHALADWLHACRIETVVMESTGVYWIPLFQILEARGFEVHLVTARQATHVPGRTTDIADCQWLQRQARELNLHLVPKQRVPSPVS